LNSERTGVEKKGLRTLQERFGYWRQEVAGLSLRALQEAVNAHLTPGSQVSLGTVSNYEGGSENEPMPGPRAEFLVALKRAFPNLNLNWLLFGAGSPTELGADVEIYIMGKRVDAPFSPYWPDTELPNIDWAARVVVGRCDLPAEVGDVLASFLVRVFASRLVEASEHTREELLADVERYVEANLDAPLNPDRLLTRAERAAEVLALLAVLYMRELGGSPDLLAR
jgi:hypothetical protein